MTILLTIIASILGVSTLGLGYLYSQERERTKKLDSLKNIKNDILTFGDQKSQMENLINSLKTETSKVQTLVSDLQNSKSQLEKQLNLLKSDLARTEASLTRFTSQNIEEQQKVLQLQRQTQNAQAE